MEINKDFYMDSRGVYTIDFLFSIFLTLTIGIIVLNLIGNALEDQKTIEEDMGGRILIDNIANTINQVNSNNLGHMKEINIPDNISGKDFRITINYDEVVLELENKKADSALIPIRIVNVNLDPIEEVKIYPGNSYKIKKSLDNNNLTVIQIYND
ncbi:hypothetical protein MBBAR_6c01020 [Methanobrevibacter arboriphilus JCM 13429 = DSM 1125]|uniref:Class III signal peptide-containing protein n=2 Tax=Methanobrevibacter arboriphilus TaxID=39441 RepID=A0A1V6N313_METAZ|nr:hypothetical protein [Methanobrevibacter arboriphilus]OQD58992.1 hypothetical protein MBBAR_6c01020 [Methanobrevibacter arboriphilus JCM 13429 = DSM 1125]